MSGQYIINFTDPIKPPFTINSLETEGPGSLNTVPIVTANGGVGGNFAVSGDFTPRFIPGFAFNVVGSLVAPPNNGAYVVASSVFQGTSNIDAISAVQKKFVLNGFDYTAVFTPGRIFKIANSQTPVSNNGYWIVASSAFVAGNTEIIVAVGVPAGYRDGNTIDGSGSAATPIVSAQAAPTNKFTVTGNQTAYFTPAFAFTVAGTPSNNGAYTVLSSTYNVILNQTIITVTTPVAANQGAVGSILFTLVTGNISTNLTVILPTVAVPTSVNFPDGDITYTLVGSTSLTLPGRGSVNYGLNIIEDLVHMLENFYNLTPPVNPTKGQLWYDSVGDTLKVYNNGAVFVPITGGGSAQPLNQVVYGTGGGISSEAEFTWNPTTNTMTLGSTVTPATIRAPDDVATTPGTLSILGGSTPSANNGGDISITAGAAGNFNNGGFVFITSGTSALGNGGGVNIAGANSPSMGGSVQLLGGQGGSSFAGGIGISGGSASGGVTGGGGVTITGGTSTGGAQGGQIDIVSGNGGGVNAPGGGVTFIAGNATGTGLGGGVYIASGVSVTGTYGNVQISTNAGFIENISTGFGTAGDATSNQYIVSTETTNATTTELLLDSTGGTRRMVLADNSTWNFEIKVVARRTDAANESFSANYEGSIDRQVGAATTALVGGVLAIPLGDDSGGTWVVLVDADAVNGALRVQVTGEIAKTIRWTAFARTVEVTN